MAGENCILSSKNYGTRRVRCLAFGHGIQIISSEDASRNGRAFYSEKVSTASFSVILVFNGSGEYNDLSAWLRGYGYRASDPDGNVGMMRVIIPAYHFDRAAVPASSFGFGKQVGPITYRMVVTFDGGTTSPDEPPPHVSAFVNAADRANSYFYPAGVQLSGANAGDTFYDDDSAPDLLKLGRPS